MSCEKPLVVLNPRYRGLSDSEKFQMALELYDQPQLFDEFVEVPCGRCRGCEKSMQYQYGLRLLYELQSHPPNSSLFVTLTFDEDHLKEHKDDLNKPVLRFLDVLRKRYGSSLRHWAVCEFGTLKGRPHFHMILFGCPPALIQSYLSNKVGFHPVIDRLWRCGMTFTGYVNEDTCRYVSKYVTKSLNGKYVRPRLISSVGIGMKYVEDNLGFHNDGNGHLQPVILVGGKPMPLPRYYYNKIFSADDKRQLAKARFMSGEFYWKGKVYKCKIERDRVRARSYASNLREKLSTREKYPTKVRNHKKSILLSNNLKTDFDL